MSWKAEMLCEGKWETNGLRFATQEEAEVYAADLFSRWMVPSDKRAVECDDPVTHQIDELNRMSRVEPPAVPVVVITDEGVQHGTLTDDGHGDVVVVDP